jgi:hypothetical protein
MAHGDDELARVVRQRDHQRPDRWVEREVLHRCVAADRKEHVNEAGTAASNSSGEARRSWCSSM